MKIYNILHLKHHHRALSVEGDRRDRRDHRFRHMGTAVPGLLFNMFCSLFVPLQGHPDLEERRFRKGLRSVQSMQNCPRKIGVSYKEHQKLELCIEIKLCDSGMSVASDLMPTLFSEVQPNHFNHMWGYIIGHILCNTMRWSSITIGASMPFSGQNFV